MDFESTQYNKREAAAERLATASLILGIVSLVSTLCCCPFIFSAIGIVLALLSKGAEKALRPRAKTGLILSVIGLVISVVIVVLTVVYSVFTVRNNPEYFRYIEENPVLRDQMNQSMEQDEELFRKIYGDDFVDKMKESIDKDGSL